MLEDMNSSNGFPLNSGFSGTGGGNYLHYNDISRPNSNRPSNITPSPLFPGTKTKRIRPRQQEIEIPETDEEQAEEVRHREADSDIVEDNAV